MSQDPHTKPADISTTWFHILCLPLIVVIAFLMFCAVLVVALIGYIDPHSSPREELDKLFDIFAAIHSFFTQEI
jgi:Mn2+/Fe2+ NRAMP family transporter